MPWTTAGAKDVLEVYFSNKTLYAALFNAVPTQANSEVVASGGSANAPGYARLQVPSTLLDAATVDNPNNRANAASDANLDFGVAPQAWSTTPTYVGLMTAATGGTLIAYDDISVSQPAAGERVRIPMGQLIARAYVSGTIPS